MTRTLRLTVISATALLALAAPIGSAPAADGKTAIHLDGAWARQAPMGGQAGSGHGGAGTKGNGAVYVRISNHGREADAMVSAASEASDVVEFHETVNDRGVMKMRPLSKMAVPADGKVEMKPVGPGPVSLRRHPRCAHRGRAAGRATAGRPPHLRARASPRSACASRGRRWAH
jgi:copper(I)-binding protein